MVEEEVFIGDPSFTETPKKLALTINEKPTTEAPKTTEGKEWHCCSLSTAKKIEGKEWHCCSLSSAKKIEVKEWHCFSLSTAKKIEGKQWQQQRCEFLFPWCALSNKGRPPQDLRSGPYAVVEREHWNTPSRYILVCFGKI